MQRWYVVVYVCGALTVVIESGQTGGVSINQTPVTDFKCLKGQGKHA